VRTSNDVTVEPFSLLFAHVDLPRVLWASMVWSLMRCARDKMIANLRKAVVFRYYETNAKFNIFLDEIWFSKSSRLAAPNLLKLKEIRHHGVKLSNLIPLKPSYFCEYLRSLNELCNANFCLPSKVALAVPINQS
jgi:hypothetical protein